VSYLPREATGIEHYEKFAFGLANFAPFLSSSSLSLFLSRYDDLFVPSSDLCNVRMRLPRMMQRG